MAASRTGEMSDQAKMEKTTDDFLHVGDSLVLEESLTPGSFMSTEGHDADSQLSMEETGMADSAHSIFIVCAQHNYRYEKQLSRELEADGISRVKAQMLPKYKDLFAAVHNEAQVNHLEFAQKQGSDVRYGMVVQLQHVLSGRYVIVSRKRADSGDGCKVVVDANAGELAWFRILPRLRVHSEGERVHKGDPVVFESLKSGLCLTIYDGRLTIQSEMTLHAPRKEVVALRGTAHATAFHVHVFRGFADHRRQRMLLLGGKPLRLHHKEVSDALSTKWVLAWPHTRSRVHTHAHKHAFGTIPNPPPFPLPTHGCACA